MYASDVCINAMCVCTGDPQNHRPGYGAQNEPAEVKSTQHAEGGATHEQALTSKHTRVRP